MREKRCDRVKKQIKPLTIAFYYGSIDPATLPADSTKFLVNSSSDIKSKLENYPSFSSKNDTAELFIYSKDEGMFDATLPSYIKVHTIGILNR